MLLTMITVCGVLMISIAVSDPRVASTLHLSPEYVSHDVVEAPEQPGAATPVLLLGLGEKEKRTSQSSSAQSTAEYKILRAGSDHMPRDRVIVRRGGIVGGN